MAASTSIPVLAALLALSCSGGETSTDAMEESIDIEGEEAVVDVPVEDVTAEETPPPPCIEREDACLDAACHDPPFDVTCLGGWMLDENGDPIPGQGVAACADDTCYLGSVYEDGWFAVNLPGTPNDHVKLSFPGTESRLRPFCLYDILCDGAVSACHRFVLRSGPTTGTSLPEGTISEDLSIEADDTAALVLPAGSEIEIPFEAETWMALTRYPLDEHVPCFLDPSDLPLALYAVTPLASYVFEPGTTTTTPAALDLPNETGLAPDTVVDVRVLGGSYLIHIDLMEGEWEVMAAARVTTDGARIQTLPGEGIAYLSWFGIYPH
jgi:hypothetical protein